MSVEGRARISPDEKEMGAVEEVDGAVTVPAVRFTAQEVTLASLR